MNADGIGDARCDRQVEVLVDEIGQRYLMGDVFGAVLRRDDVIVKKKNEQSCQIRLQILVTWENEGAPEHREQEVSGSGQNFATDQPVLDDDDGPVNLDNHLQQLLREGVDRFVEALVQVLGQGWQAAGFDEDVLEVERVLKKIIISMFGYKQLFIFHCSHITSTEQD